ncbi:MAG: haloacid dehalogenase-like hydrolase [Candidatus Hydrogenedentota bacterium]|nr:MAG: haloacid dehalogenase-like hydrolase [Candidatus Hydrogenedentota bacterium]
MAEQGLFLQNIIAIIWDFDKTLSPHNMQKPLFEHYGIVEENFWKEVNALPGYYAQAGVKIQEDTCYLGHILSYVKHGSMPGLSNAKLKELGADIELFQGVPECFDALGKTLDTPEFRQGDLRLEHYIVSTGLEAMIQGSPIADHVNGIWASAFIEEPAAPNQDFTQPPGAGEISHIAGFLDNTTKTRAIFEINKGVNVSEHISVNDAIPREKRRVPFENMIYIADGPSDIPSFSVMNQNGGLAYAVHDPDSDAHYKQAMHLCESGRVHQYGPADYRPESPTFNWLKVKIEKMAERIMSERSLHTEAAVKKAPTHG